MSDLPPNDLLVKGLFFISLVIFMCLILLMLE